MAELKTLPEQLETARLRHEMESRNPKTRREAVPKYTSSGRTFIGFGKKHVTFAKPGQVEVEVE
jgi:hypothetical protein